MKYIEVRMLEIDEVTEEMMEKFKEESSQN